MRPKAKIVAALIVLITVAGWITYRVGFSPEAHAKHTCETAWSDASADLSAMETEFDQFLVGSTQRWLTAAQHLRDTITDRNACFDGDYAGYASNDGYYNVSGIDSSALVQEIACVAAGGDYHCDVPGNPRLSIPVTMPTGNTYPVPATIPQVPFTYTPGPTLPPISNGATAICRDGSYSYSQHHQGTCSHHGGVQTWLK